MKIRSFPFIPGLAERVKEYEGEEIIVDVEAQLSPEARHMFGIPCVALFQGDPSFDVMEKAAYGSPNKGYCLEGLSEIWVYEEFVTEARMPFLQTLFEGLPIKRIPYTYVPDIYIQKCPLTMLQNITLSHVLIAEKNTSVTSSCIIPILGALKAKNVSTIHLQNATHLEKDAFFQENIISIQRKPILYESSNSSSSMYPVITHTRFHPFRPDQLDLVWRGIPFFHNSTFLRDAGQGLEATYYNESDVEDLTRVLESFSIEAWLKNDESRRQWVGALAPPHPLLLKVEAPTHPLLLKVEAPTHPLLLSGEGMAGLLLRNNPVGTCSPHLLLSGGGMAGLLLRNNPVGTCSSAGALLQQRQQFPESKTRETCSPHLNIGFTDMWEGFDAKDNFFLDILKSLDSPYTLQGLPTYENANLLICGPFGSSWTSATCPKVFFSGERVIPSDLEDNRIDLYLTHAVQEDSRHIRLPLWPLFLDWLGLGTQVHRNPNGLPTSLAFKPIPINPRRDFCAFIVSNPTNEERNAAFEALNAYRPVHSAGAYKNNIGGPIPCAYGGGGGGDAAKVAYLQTHEYSLCYENSVSPGYVTEKLLHAKLAGCIPLYRGPAEAAQDFCPEGFVAIKDTDSIVDVVKALEADPERKRLLRATPALNPIRLKAAEQLLGRVATRLLELATHESLQNTIVIQKPIEKSCQITAPLFVTFATEAFISSMKFCFQSLKALRTKEPGIRIRAYLGTDVVDRDALYLAYPDVEFRLLPSVSPVPDFPDFLEPSMYGWKLWILKTLCEESDLEDDLVLYTDAGTTWLDVPSDMLQVVNQNGVCCVVDRNQLNRFWCSEDMCTAMSVTEEEKNQNQIQAACIGMKAGSAKALSFFREAYHWGSQKACLFGPKWIPGRNGGDYKYNGHRHDQSILSILALRHQIPCVEGLRFSTTISLRKAYQRSVPLYHHRGRPVNHEPVWPRIDDIWAISLDRRADRYRTLLNTYPALDGILNRLPGIDGKELTLTDSLTRLFAPNDFKWKKSVVGCALSHILLWAQLVSEHPAVQSYLILEDDVRFIGSYKDTWAAAAACIPADAELLLLGGVLPGNVPAYEPNIIPVNDVWATIRPNGLFTGGYVCEFFHFCAYSYVLTRAGAKKLIDAIQTKGVNTSIDNFLCHPAQGLKKYVMRNLMTTCFQAEDPVYKTAAFDEFLRVDSYDSDIWNNKECFVPVCGGDTPPPQLWPCILDVLQTQPHSIQTRNTLRESALSVPQTIVYYYDYKGPPSPALALEGPPSPALALEGPPSLALALEGPHKYGKGDGMLEEQWIHTLYPNLVYKPFVSAEAVVPHSWLLITRPNIPFWTSVTKALIQPFRILHLSDEDCQDDISLYVKSEATIRNYIRPNLPSSVSVIPLGPAISRTATSIPTFQQRPLKWSFHGSKGESRLAALEPLRRPDFEPYDCRFIASFMDTSRTSDEDYRSLLLRSQFVPILPGQNPETFRLYEALEHGAIPLYVRSAGDELFWNWITHHISLLNLPTWESATKMIVLFQKNPEKAEHYRQGLIKQWTDYKNDLSK